MTLSQASRRTDFGGATREALNLSLSELNGAWMNYLAGLSSRKLIDFFASTREI
ncbi:MAG TPA: hypothetical protein VNO14_03925 [Blastocatellia bacterium]|nr:hypothetical protein [Blastocatellia bacterium]